MSISPIQTQQIENSFVVDPHPDIKQDFSIEFQRAFEEFNLEEIYRCLSEGANPNQIIEMNPKFSFSFLKAYIEEVFDRDSFICELSTITTEEIESFIIDQNVIDQVMNTVNALNESPDSVEDVKLIEVATVLQNAYMYEHPAPDYPKISPMALALSLPNLDLVKSLVNAGFDFSNAKFMEGLVGHNYSVILTEPQTGDTLFSCSLSFTAMDHVAGNKTLEDLFLRADREEDLNRIHELQNQGCVLDFKHELGNIFGTLDLEDIEEIMEGYVEIINFLKEHQVPNERLFDLQDGLFARLQFVENPNPIIDFLTSLGFEVPPIDLTYESPFKNCWDPRDWGLTTIEEESEPLSPSEIL